MFLSSSTFTFALISSSSVSFAFRAGAYIASSSASDCAASICRLSSAVSLSYLCSTDEVDSKYFT